MAHMAKKLLTDKFFRENPLKEMSAARIAYIMITDDEWFEKIAKEAAKGTISKERQATIKEEQKTLAALDDPTALFLLLRKDVDVLNRSALVDKALGHEDVILPQVVEKLIRSNYDPFIENAVILLARSDPLYIDELRERYGEIRSGYVKSMVCMLLGFDSEEEIIPWMLEQYHALEERYPDQDYEEGPLIALYELDYRFN